MASFSVQFSANRFKARLLLVIALLLAVVSSGCKSSSEIAAPAATSGSESSAGSSSGQTMTISGSPEPRAMAFGFYEFVPQASHREDKTLTFRIEGKPAWARFDARSGTLAGIPAPTDVGLYAGITLFVSDGVLELALPAFSIEVYVPPLVSATLLWAPPTHRIDGTVLDDLAGYVVQYGTSRYRFPHVLEVSNAAATMVLVENIPADRTYFFKVLAVDAFGKQSPPSQVIEVAL